VLDEELAEFGVVNESAGVGEFVPQVAPAGPVFVDWIGLACFDRAWREPRLALGDVSPCGGAVRQKWAMGLGPLIRVVVVVLAASAGVWCDVGRSDRVPAVWPGGVGTGAG
jgi:hypothetical protein